MKKPPIDNHASLILIASNAPQWLFLQAIEAFTAQVVCYERLIMPVVIIRGLDGPREPLDLLSQDNARQRPDTEAQLQSGDRAQADSLDPSVPATSNEGGPLVVRWQCDSVLAAEMQFRFSLLAPCIQNLPQVSSL